MSNQSHTPRVEKLDVDFFSDRLSNYLAKRQRDLVEQPSERRQSDWYSLAIDGSHIGFYRFALGYPVDQVRQAFSEAAFASLKVFELLGTMDNPQVFPVLPPGTKDYSLTNARRCFEGICTAFIAGRYEIVNKLAELMWDPPKATYVGLNSEVCTLYQQHLAYALKHVLLNQPEQVKKELGRVGHRRGEEQVAAMAKMVRGVGENNAAWLAEGLLELLFWHRKEAEKPHRQSDPERFFSLAGVGLSILAVRRGLLKKSELPDDPYLPLELIPD